MRKTVFIVLSLVAAAAAAQNNRSFVATYGNDANNCTAGNECRTFSRALSVTNPGGEVLALTSGGYGPFTITQAVSVIATTGAASVTAGGTTAAISITAGSTDAVALKGLAVTVTDTSTIGIYAHGYARLTIDGCSVNGGAAGVVISGSGTSRASVVNTVVRGVNGDGFVAGSASTLTGCIAEKNTGAGLIVTARAGSLVSAKGFVSSGNQYGVHVQTILSPTTVTVSLDHALLANNTSDGIFCDGVAGSTTGAYVTESTIVQNGGYGFNASSFGTVFTMQNNAVAANTLGSTNGTITAMTPQ